MRSYVVVVSCVWCGCFLFRSAPLARSFTHSHFITLLPVVRYFLQSNGPRSGGYDVAGGMPGTDPVQCVRVP